MKLAIVIPVYNEAQCIEKVSQEWAQVAEKYQGQVLFVNDGSTDDTGELLDRLSEARSSLRVIHQKNSGHGRAIRRGYESVVDKASYIFQTDSDDQFFKDDFDIIWAARDADLVLGVRKDRNDPIHRLVITKIAKQINRLFFGTTIRDANIPFRLMKQQFLERALVKIPRDVFAPNIFISIYAFYSGASVCEIPVRHKERETGAVSIIRFRLLKVCFKSFLELFHFRKSLLSKKHDGIDIKNDRLAS